MGISYPEILKPFESSDWILRKREKECSCRCGDADLTVTPPCGHVD